LLLALALAMVPSLARAEVRLDGGQADHGVVVEARLGSQFVTLATTGPTTTGFTLDGLQGGVFGGYKIKRFIFGLGFDLARIASGTSVSGGGTTSTATTSVMFTPGLSVAILRSADRRVEFFGQFDLGFGTTVGDSIASGESIFRLAYDVAPGIRFWAHPQFAFGAVAGVAGSFTWDSQSGNGAAPGTTSSSGLTSIFAQLQVMGVF
jgi:hypothetical protein